MKIVQTLALFLIGDIFKILSKHRPGGLMINSMIEMRVEDAGEEILRYSFGSIKEASEMLVFLKEFFPSGSFLIQPLRH